MKCNACLRDISKAEMAKRVEYRRDPADKATERIYGINMADGPLEKAAGPMIKVLHGKCYYVIFKREQRGKDKVEGTQAVGAYDEDDQPTRIRQAREADPDHKERTETDWRDQTVLDVEDIV